MVCLAYSYTTRILWEIKNILCLYDVRIQIVVVSDRYIYRDEAKQKFVNQNNICAIIIIIITLLRTLPKKYQGLKRRNEHLPDPSRINSPSTSQLLSPSLSSSLPQKSAKSRMLGSRYRRHGPSQEHRGWFTAAQRQPGWNIRSSRAACFSNFVLLSLEKKKRIRKERERKREKGKLLSP